MVIDQRKCGIEVTLGIPINDGWDEEPIGKHNQPEKGKSNAISAFLLHSLTRRHEFSRWVSGPQLRPKEAYYRRCNNVRDVGEVGRLVSGIDSLASVHDLDMLPQRVPQSPAVGAV
jgi:hypothetical protein